MQVIDFKKDPIYKAKTKPQIINIPEMSFVMIDGEGAPESSSKSETEFQEALAAMYGIVYTIKFWEKKFTPPAGYAKFTMAPLEALWWMKNGHEFDMNQPDEWRWTAMIRVPEFVTPEYFGDVITAVKEAKKSDVYGKARQEKFTEGTCVQIMHIGPYNQEQADIDAMHAYAIEQGHKLRGKHHELYFGDPRRTAPEKLKTILRRPC